MVDALCLLDLDPYGRELNSPLDELYQDLVHRLFERPGSNIDDPNRGVGIEDLLSSGFDVTNGGGPSQVIAQRIEQDFLKDNRVSTVAAGVTQLSAASPNVGAVYQVTIQVVADEDELQIVLQSNGGGGVIVVSTAPGAT